MLSLVIDEEDPTLVHGQRLGSAWIEERARALGALTVYPAREMRGMHPTGLRYRRRGTLVVAEVLRHFGLDELEVSERDLLRRRARRRKSCRPTPRGPRRPGAYTCC